MESTTIATSSTVGSVAALEPTSPPATSQLLVSANQVTTLTAQDLQDSLVEQSLSETILLQNVTFDSNLFDGLNLELSEGAGGGEGGAVSANTNSVNLHQLGTTIDLSSISSDAVTQHSLDQLNLLETLEMQIIKEVQQHQHQHQSASSSSQYLTSSSSDPLVSSTTTIYAYEKSDEQQMLANADSSDFKSPSAINFSGAFSAISKSSPMMSTLTVKSEPSHSQIVKGSAAAAAGAAEGGQALLSVTGRAQQQSVILQRTSDASTSTTSSMADLANFATAASSSGGAGAGEKAIYLTGPICSTGALSLANMKVVGPNVVAIISGDQQQQQQEQRLVDACKQGSSSSSEGSQAQGGHQHHQTRLIIIEEKKQQQQQPSTLTLTTTSAASTATRPSKESKGKSDNSKSSTSTATAKSNSNSASSVKEAKGKWKGKLTLSLTACLPVVVCPLTCGWSISVPV